MVFNREKVLDVAQQLIYDEVAQICDIMDNHNDCVATLGYIRGICEVAESILAEDDEAIEAQD